MDRDGRGVEGGGGEGGEEKGKGERGKGPSIISYTPVSVFYKYA